MNKIEFFTEISVHVIDAYTICYIILTDYGKD